MLTLLTSWYGTFLVDGEGNVQDQSLFPKSPEELSRVPHMPGSLEESLAALEADNTFLRKGDVFTEDLLEKWATYKKENELDPVRLRPVPYEFALYFDI